MPADPGACARCAARFSTCCRIRLEDAECCFPLSGPEQAAITAHAGSETGSGTGAGMSRPMSRPMIRPMIRQENSPRFLKAMQDLFPGEGALVAAAFPPGGAHLRLALAPDGACVFLRPDGCALPRDARPVYCRMFPFWVQRREIWHFSLRECQAQREERGRPALLRSFHLSDADVFELYAVLRQGWSLPRQ